MAVALFSYFLKLFLSFQEKSAAGTDLKALLFMVNPTMLRFTSNAGLMLNT